MYSFFKKYIDLFTGRQYLAYGFLFLLCFLIMTGQNFRLVPGNDDIVHTILIDKYGSALNFMIEQYKVWNSRYFTSLIMAYIMDKNVWLWRILNTFAYLPGWRADTVPPVQLWNIWITQKQSGRHTGKARKI